MYIERIDIKTQDFKCDSHVHIHYAELEYPLSLPVKCLDKNKPCCWHLIHSIYITIKLIHWSISICKPLLQFMSSYKARLAHVQF